MTGWIGSATGFAIGVLFAGLGWPLWHRRVPPNGWYGYRTPSTLSSPAVWYPVNARGGRHIVAIGAVSALAGVIGLAWWGNTNVQRWLTWLVLGGTLLGVVISGMVCLIQARRLAHAKSDDRGDRQSHGE